MTVQASFDDIVIGAGILGLAHAHALGRRGRRVAVFERGPRAIGASIRNFGMLWPIGQPFGPRRQLAEQSLRSWHEVLAASGLWHERTGSLHVAYRDDEAEVLREFTAEANSHGADVELLSPPAARRRSSAIRSEADGLKCALWSAAETCVDPRDVIANLPEWLARSFDITFHFAQPITAVEPPRVISGGRSWSGNRVWICSGDELNVLYADALKASGLIACKLQMMRTEPVPRGLRMGPMLAGGLTLRHYASFRNCPSLPALCERVASESPWFDQLGVHVLVSQNRRGELTLGDSHEYGDSIEPFDKTEIDELVIAYLRSFFEFPIPKIASRWHGTYVKHPTDAFVELNISDSVKAVTGLGGAGMTLSFGLAEAVVARALGS